MQHGRLYGLIGCNLQDVLNENIRCVHVLIEGPLKAELQIRTWVMVVYLGGDTRKNEWGSEESATEDANKGVNIFELLPYIREAQRSPDICKTHTMFVSQNCLLVSRKAGALVKPILCWLRFFQGLKCLLFLAAFLWAEQAPVTVEKALVFKVGFRQCQGRDCPWELQQKWEVFWEDGTLSTGSFCYNSKHGYLYVNKSYECVYLHAYPYTNTHIEVYTYSCIHIGQFWIIYKVAGINCYLWVGRWDFWKSGHLVWERTNFSMSNFLN